MKKIENKKIIRLSQEVSNKIAAGEVVDRPVSIVKELVENSIDAGADSIILEIRDGGKTYIRVTDNGSGISKEYLELAFERHATSKIETAEDIDNIQFLGFRGEALASIAAVSHVEIITKTHDSDTGMRMKISGGSIEEKKETGCPEGTTLIVRDLFYNVPARLKFLKQNATEAHLIIDLLSKMSLAYPDIKFRLINNSKILFTTQGTGDMQKNIRAVYNQEIADELLEVIGDGEYYQLKAYISKPSTTKSNRRYQIFFVNGRYIQNSTIEKSISKAYQELLFDNRYPVVFLFLKVNPLWVDVNIHPNKKEVKFRDEKMVEEFLSNTLREKLKTRESIPDMIKKEPFKIPEKSIFKSQEMPMIQKQESFKMVDINKILETKKEDHVKAEETQKTFKAFENKDNLYFTEEKRPLNLLSLKIMGTAFGTYILAGDENYIYFIDQHAAHERVLYERFLKEYREEKILVQSLLMPEILDLSLPDSFKVEKNMDFIRRIGFDIALFGPNSYVIKGTPYAIELQEAINFLHEIIENLEEDFVCDNPSKIERIIGKACKKAVKAHDFLNEKEIDGLLSSLSKTDNPYSCPHGRPVFIKISQADLERKFKR